MKQTSRALLAAAISAACLGAVPTAHANTFNLKMNGFSIHEDYDIPSSLPDGIPVSANLFITTAGDASGFEAVTGVTGTIFGQTITGLAGDNGFGWAPVNQFTANEPWLNQFGIFVSGPGSDRWRILNDNGGFMSNNFAINNTTGYWTTTMTTLSVSAVSPVPEPESFAMLIAGLGVLGAVSRRQKKSSPRMVALA